jgi:hypothetical protein
MEGKWFGLDWVCLIQPDNAAAPCKAGAAGQHGWPRASKIGLLPETKHKL